MVQIKTKRMPYAGSEECTSQTQQACSLQSTNTQIIYTCSAVLHTALDAISCKALRACLGIRVAAFPFGTVCGAHVPFVCIYCALAADTP